MPTIRSIQPNISFADAAFDPAQSGKFCLVAEIGLKGMSIAVLDNISNTFLAFESYEFRKVNSEKELAEKVGRIIGEHEWLTNGFKRTDVMMVTERFTLVPSAFFESDKAKEFLGFNHPLTDADEISSDQLRNADTRLLYANEKELMRQVRKLSQARIHHHLSSLIERTLSVNKAKTGRRALVHVQRERFDLVISEGGKLILANTFQYQTSEDLIYYLLFSCEQLKMNPDQMEVDVVGEIAADSSVVMLIRKYVRNVSLGASPVDAKFAKGFEQFPSHYHYALFSLHYFS
ncbi:MAG TPA: DUF3822 family protein [Bacteroidia bacterium]|jgi:hypothetical protein|nr:DUF3822 family protein [Bacteroidia bacterium]